MDLVIGLIAIVALLLVVGPVARAEDVGEAAQKKALPNPDLICGPRCVQMVLSHYGHEEDLMALVKEIQWPELEKGSSLTDVGKALQKRGIHTYAMRLAPNAQLCWRSPAIVFLKGNGPLGHFAVWLPGAQVGMDTLWLGMGKSQTARSVDLAQWCSAVLLTASEPILDPNLAVRAEPNNFSALAVGAVVMALAAGLLVVAFRRKARRSEKVVTT
jgi:hypothetical protein